MEEQTWNETVQSKEDSGDLFKEKQFHKGETKKKTQRSRAIVKKTKKEIEDKCSTRGGLKATPRLRGKEESHFPEIKTTI